jgi:hypothetical protein
MKNNSLKKGIIICLACLFLSSGITPVIVANNSIGSWDEKLVDVYTDVIGIQQDSQHKVQMSNKEVNKLNEFLNETQRQLENAQNSQQIRTIYNRLIEKLVSYNLLGEKQIEQTGRLVNFWCNNLQKIKQISSLNQQKNKFADDENFFCFFASRSDNLFIFSPLSLLCSLIFFFWDTFIPPPEGFEWVAYVMLFFLGVVPECIDMIRPVLWHSALEYGRDNNGWAFSFGLNGKKTWNGSLDGKIQIWGDSRTAVVGFTGIRIFFDKGNLYNSFVCGTAYIVKIDLAE